MEAACYAPSNIATANSVRQSRGSLITRLLCGAGSRSFSMLPSRFERTHGIQGIFQGFFLLRSSFSVKDFSSTLYHGIFSFWDSLPKNPFVRFQNGGSVQSSPITIWAWGKCRHNDLRIKEIKTEGLPAGS
jgi:hypothetical protein